MTVLYVLLREWKLAVIGILSVLLLATGVYTSGLKLDNQKLQTSFSTYVRNVEEAKLKQEVEEAEKALEVTRQFHEIEVKHNAQITKLAANLTAANNAKHSMSVSLANAEARIKTDEADKVRAYSLELSNVFRECNATQLELGKTLDEHRINAESIKEKYNTLVDYVNNNYNK